MFSFPLELANTGLLMGEAVRETLAEEVGGVTALGGGGVVVGGVTMGVDMPEFSSLPASR